MQNVKIFTHAEFFNPEFTQKCINYSKIQFETTQRKLQNTNLIYIFSQSNPSLLPHLYHTLLNSTPFLTQFTPIYPIKTVTLPNKKYTKNNNELSTTTKSKNNKIAYGSNQDFFWAPHSDQNGFIV